MLLRVSGGPVAREQILVVVQTLLVLRYPAEDILKRGPFINTTCLTGGKQGVYDSGSLGGLSSPQNR